MSFIGPKWSEEKLISYAYAYEQRTQFRRFVKPRIVPKTELPASGGDIKSNIIGFLQSTYQKVLSMEFVGR